MAIGCQCGVGGRKDRRRGWLKSIGCRVGWGDMAEYYRVSVWGGGRDDSCQVEWLMAIGCQCGVGGRDDRCRGWLKSIGCQCGVGVG